MKRSPIPHETHFLTKPRVINDQQNHSLIPVRVFCVFRGLYFMVLFFFQIHIGHLRFLNPGHARRQSKQSISLYEHAQPTHQLNPISCISCVSWSIFRGLILFSNTRWAFALSISRPCPKEIQTKYLVIRTCPTYTPIKSCSCISCVSWSIFRGLILFSNPRWAYALPISRPCPKAIQTKYLVIRTCPTYTPIKPCSCISCVSWSIFRGLILFSNLNYNIDQGIGHV